MPAVIIGVVLACFIGACSGESELSETTTAVTTVIESVLKNEHTTDFISATTEAMSSTVLPETTKKQSTSTQKQTTTQKETTNNITTTEKKTTTTTTKATTTKKVIATNKPATTAKLSTTKKVTTTKKPTTKKVTAANNGSETGEMVWIPESGKKYHNNSSCSNMKNPSKVSVSKAKQMGYTPCKKCY